MPPRKLNKEQSLSIRTEYLKGSALTTLAARHECSLSTIILVLQGKHWTTRDLPSLTMNKRRRSRKWDWD